MQSANRDAADRLRRTASVLWLAAAVIMTLLICMLVFYRNPWITHRVAADQVNSQTLDQLAQGRSPYVRTDRMNLTFTGYYETDRRDAVRAYCYMGEVSDGKVLVLLPAEDGGKLLETAQTQSAQLTDYSVKGRIVRSHEIADQLARAQQMSVEEYQDYYDFTGLEMHAFHNDQEQICHQHRGRQCRTAVHALDF